MVKLSKKFKYTTRINDLCRNMLHKAKSNNN